MTSPPRTAISALPKGHEFDAASFTPSDAHVAAYLLSVGDTNDYAGTVPPLAAVALGLATLQDQLSLPEGSLHTTQEAEHAAAIRSGESLKLTGRVAQRSERQGFIISVIEFEISTPDAVAIRARTTIMAPGTAS